MAKKPRIIKVPILGRYAVVPDRHGSATRMNFPGSAVFETNLTVKVFDKDGKEKMVKDYFGTSRWERLKNALLYGNKTELDLGSGLVTNVGVLALANDWNWANPTTAINVFKQANNHATGTGATAAAATDIKLQTVSTANGQVPVAGTQSLISAANLQKYQTVATISYTGTEAVTEWGLFLGTIAGALTGATGSPFTAGSATSGTVTGTPLTASTSSVQGEQTHVFERTSGTNLSWGLVTSNTTSVITVPAWYLVSSGAAGQAPANTETYLIRPCMWDHKVFSAINVVNGDSIQFTYTLTINSGG